MTSSATRGTWKNKGDFVLALISYGVGLGNVWRFPYLAYSSGGGAFLIPFLISSVIVGIPYALLEVSLGQWMKEGGIGAWNLTPIFKGIGFANLIIVFFANVYYEVILAWSLLYLYDSFGKDLPWKYCSNYWNTECCSEALLYGAGAGKSSSSPAASQISNDRNHINRSVLNIVIKNREDVNSPPILIAQSKNVSIECAKLFDPITEYWERKILAISGGIEEVGHVKMDLLLALLVAWLVVYFSIFRGMKNSRFVVYVTALMPYVFLFILLLRGLFLPGALDGIIYYLKPDWEKLTRVQVWSDAGTQIFYSYGIGIAALVALGSYNKFHYNSYRDVVLFTITNSLTSILSGFVIFSVLGYMSYMQGVGIDEVAEEGPGLAFIVYPQALALMPFSPLWSIMFFFMLFLLGLGTQLVAVEAITTSLVDEYLPIIKQFVDFKYTKQLLTGMNVLISFVCGIPMITNGGMYVFQIFDYYAASRTLLFVGLFECIAISYFYGADRYCNNLEKMWKFKVGPWLRIMWVFATPFFTFILIIFTVMTYEDLTYNRTYKYPSWALRFGWILSVSSFICIPIYAVYKFIVTGGSLQERYFKMRLARLKSHQLEGDNVSDELNNEYETRVETTTADTSAMVITEPSTLATLTERCSAVVLKLNNQEMDLDDRSPRCDSTSDEENNLSFANSRTIIKP